MSKLDYCDSTILVLDTSSSVVFAGLLKNGEWLKSTESTEPTLEILFTLVNQILVECNLHFDEIDYYLYDRGPGSILGIRTAIAAIQSWEILSDKKNSIRSFQSLDLIGGSLKREGKDNFSIISDWKKGYWNIWQDHRDPEKTISTIDLEGIQTLSKTSHSTYYLPQRKVWKPLPIELESTLLNPLKIKDLLENSSLIKNTAFQTAYLPEQTKYIKWNAKRHR